MTNPSCESPIRLRLMRLLRGEYASDDLYSIFLHARGLFPDFEILSEIGHFLAHKEERDRGITARMVEEWSLSVRFFLVPIALNETISFWRLPQVAPRYLRIAAHRVSGQNLKSTTGLTRRRAHKLLCDLSHKLVSNGDGTWSIPPIVSGEERKALGYICTRMISKPAFNGQRIAREFLAALRISGTLRGSEIRANIDLLSRMAQLFAISAMHNALVVTKDGEKLRLSANPFGENYTLAVIASVPVPLQNGSIVQAAAPLFVTDLKSEAYCCPSLLLRAGNTMGNDTDQYWNFDLVLGTGGVLIAAA